MKIKYLGTAAYEGWPSIFCACDSCRRARAAQGKNLRSRSQALINDDLLLDFPPDTSSHVLRYGLDLSKLRHILITHTHSDHFYPEDLIMHANGCYSHYPEDAHLNLVGDIQMVEAYQKFLEEHPSEPKDNNLSVFEIPHHTPMQLENYTVTALHARHMSHEDANVYVITDGKKTILYLHDTGRLAESEHEYLRDNGIHADLVSFDCTFGPKPSSQTSGHMGLVANIEQRDILRQNGVIDDATICVVNHFSHNGGMIYDEFAPYAKDFGFLVSYDGMELEI